MNKIKPESISLGDDIVSITKAAIEDLKKDEGVYKAIRELGLTSSQVKSGLPAILDFQTDFHQCQNCPGLDKCSKPEKGLKAYLDVYEGMVRLCFDRCEKKKSLDAMTSLFITRSFPTEWMLDEFKSIEWTGKRVQKFREVVTAILKGQSKDWIYLTGNHRAGKSYLLAFLAYKYAKTFGPVAFCDTHSLIDKMKEASINNKPKFEKMFNTLCNCPLLVLDDFGSEFKSDFVFSTILYPILNARSKSDLITCFSSKFKIKDIASMYKVKIGDVMAREYESLLNDMSGGEIDVSGLALH